MQALELMCEQHKLVTGKKVRSDNNVLFEHVVWLSEQQYKKLEEQYGKKRVKAAFLKRLQLYAESVKRELGFEPLGIDIHMDEGHTDNTGRFIRNIHAHVQFMNYDFSKRRAPLRHMMKKGKDRNGKTHQLNPKFERLQTLDYEQFKGLGFQRGKSKLITGREHLAKELFVKNKQKKLISKVQNLSQQDKELQRTILSLRSETRSLEEQIIQQRSELSWLQKHIEQLKQTHKEMAVAIKSKSQHILRSLLRKTDSATNSYPKPKQLSK
ncbi:hypothetical protein [Pseudoalteromonas piscicida]|uniref:hypothetical protein n=1 Tax=Pseudoalteromonas piscicida TaxID=43662 RepID=UPI000E35FF49|nr:hypothetical protein [Pseudoalteromonas piscicida]AXQ99177.1 hypothetical protein D0N37_16560 [Pseudoalteromonas piscicida]